MKTEDAFVVATIVAIMLVGSLASLLEIHRLNSEVDQLQGSQVSAFVESQGR